MLRRRSRPKMTPLRLRDGVSELADYSRRMVDAPAVEGAALPQAEICLPHSLAERLTVERPMPPDGLITATRYGSPVRGSGRARPSCR